MNQQNNSPLDKFEYKEFITRLIKNGETNATIANKIFEEFAIHTTEGSIRRFRKRHKFQIPGGEKAYTRVHGDQAEGLTSPQQFVRKMNDEPVLDDPDSMLADRGLDPEDWYVDAITVNEWDGPQKDGTVVTYYQSKFTAKKKRPDLGLTPVRSDGWKPKIVPNSALQITQFKLPIEPEQIVVVGDQQAPFYDKNLHRLFLEWLEWNQPSRGIVLGDLIDFPDISRHPSDPDNVASVQECLQSGYEILRDYVAASPNTKWQFIRGNHDQRLRQYIIDKSPYIYDLHRATTDVDAEKEYAHNLAWLMRFDELGIELVNTNGTYEDAQIVLSKNLAVRHGWVVRQGSGVSALKTLEQTHHSIIVGHTHRQSIVYHTTHDVDHTPTTLVAVEAGCMCQINNQIDDSGKRFPSYGVYPDWQQGWAIINLHQDGKFYVSLANYVNETLLYENQRYE